MGDFPAAKLTQNSIVKEKVLVGAFSVITNLRIVFVSSSISQYLEYYSKLWPEV